MGQFAFHDPAAIAVALLSAAIVGIAKGGLTGVIMLAVPVMALAISPVQAAAIILPMLIISDFVAVYTWWGTWDLRTFRLMMPGAIAGVALGWATAQYVSDDMVRLIVGVIAVAFVLRWLTQSAARRAIKAQHNAVKASFWGALTGYTSFVAHSGAPPYQVYTIPLGMDPRTYTGTNVLTFMTINLVKVVPYFLLGQFAADNLVSSAVLMPVAIAFTFVGAWIIRRMRAEVFYPVTYALVAMVGAKLIWDGIAGMT